MNNFQIKFATSAGGECFRVVTWEEGDFERNIDLSLNFSSAAQLTM